MLKPKRVMFLTLVIMLMAFSCSGPESEQPLLTAEVPLHLEEHLDAARIDGSEVPADVPQPVEWRFDEPQPDWRPSKRIQEDRMPVEAVQVDDALRLRLTAENRAVNGRFLAGAIYMDVPDWTLEDWAYVEVLARAKGGWYRVGLQFNYTEEDPGTVNHPFYTLGDASPMVSDGTVQTYRLSLNWGEMKTRASSSFRGRIEGPWTHLAVWVTCEIQEEAALDILSIRVVPKAHLYADVGVGVKEIPVGNRIRRALYTHAPSRLAYRVRVPEEGRLDMGLGVLRHDVPVTFRIEVQPRGGGPATMIEESYGDREVWGQRSIDLGEYAGRTVTLALETDAERAGTVAFWGAPTVSGSTRVAEKPNVIFYVIDGAGAEYMSLYGYNRRTTPNIDRLATEGAVFERAYSNSSWTRPSNASFMTSLQHSVLGGFKAGFNVVPEDVLTMAQHLHRAGYQTGVFTPNPNAGKMSGLDREVDVIQEAWDDFTYGRSGHWRESSRYLHDAFWTWREAYPGEPYWVHFQPVDIHGDFPAPAPFSGLFVSPKQANTWLEWREKRDRWKEKRRGLYSDVYEKIGVDRVEFFTVAQGLYDETMAYNDYQLGRLVERLKAQGEWENTLLIVAADHSIDAAFEDMAIAIQDSLPPAWNQPMLRPSITRIPLLFVWPGHIAGGQWFSEPVASMVDALPTILDLVGLPLPEVMQGQSLAPLLLGEGEVEPRPVILDEFEVDRETGEFRGLIEVIDGRWGASLEINPEAPEEDEPDERAMRRRPVPLLLYDMWNDPYCLHSIHEEQPDLVEKYTAFLEAQWEAHQALRQMFTPSEAVPLTPEQLEALRSLGYIR